MAPAVEQAAILAMAHDWAPRLPPSEESWMRSVWGGVKTLPIRDIPVPVRHEESVRAAGEYVIRQSKKGFIRDLSEFAARPADIFEDDRVIKKKISGYPTLTRIREYGGVDASAPRPEPWQKFWMTSDAVKKFYQDIEGLPFQHTSDRTVCLEMARNAVLQVIINLRVSRLIVPGKVVCVPEMKAMRAFTRGVHAARINVLGEAARRIERGLIPEWLAKELQLPPIAAESARQISERGEDPMQPRPTTTAPRAWLPRLPDSRRPSHASRRQEPSAGVVARSTPVRIVAKKEAAAAEGQEIPVASTGRVLAERPSQDLTRAWALTDPLDRGSNWPLQAVRDCAMEVALDAALFVVPRRKSLWVPPEESAQLTGEYVLPRVGLQRVRAEPVEDDVDEDRRDGSAVQMVCGRLPVPPTLSMQPSARIDRLRVEATKSSGADLEFLSRHAVTPDGPGADLHTQLCQIWNRLGFNTLDRITMSVRYSQNLDQQENLGDAVALWSSCVAQMDACRALKSEVREIIRTWTADALSGSSVMRDEVRALRRAHRALGRRAALLRAGTGDEFRVKGRTAAEFCDHQLDVLRVLFQAAGLQASVIDAIDEPGIGSAPSAEFTDDVMRGAGHQ